MTLEALHGAFTSAQVLCKYVCVEQHLEGSVCRGTVVNKKLEGFFEAKPIAVTGDGIHTVLELVEAKNAHREERVKAIELNNEHDIYIGKRGFTRESVVPQGVMLPLTHRTGRLFGGETKELLDTVHPKLRDYLEHAARTIDVPIVGFDLIIPNPEADPDTQTWGIIEANAVPFIDLHYLPLYGTPSHVAEKVWDLWN
jgi:cyanophycin synthetase